MDTKGPITYSSVNISYIFVIIDVTLLSQTQHLTISSKYAIQTLPNHWVIEFGHPQNLVTDRGTD